MACAVRPACLLRYGRVCGGGFSWPHQPNSFAQAVSFIPTVSMAGNAFGECSGQSERNGRNIQIGPEVWDKPIPNFGRVRFVCDAIIWPAIIPYGRVEGR